MCLNLFLNSACINILVDAVLHTNKTDISQEPYNLICDFGVQISNAVLTAKIMNATLVLPELDTNTLWPDDKRLCMFFKCFHAMM